MVLRLRRLDVYVNTRNSIAKILLVKYIKRNNLKPTRNSIAKILESVYAETARPRKTRNSIAKIRDRWASSLQAERDLAILSRRFETAHNYSRVDERYKGSQFYREDSTRYSTWSSHHWLCTRNSIAKIQDSSRLTSALSPSSSLAILSRRFTRERTERQLEDLGTRNSIAKIPMAYVATVRGASYTSQFYREDSRRPRGSSKAGMATSQFYREDSSLRQRQDT